MPYHLWIASEAEPLPDPVQRFQIRDIDYRLHGVLNRTPSKDMWFERPDGTRGLGGIRLADLPLYGSHWLPGQSLDVPAVVTEGPKDALTLHHLGLLALGTVTGALGTPGPAALAVLRDRLVVLWPDADAVGHVHMARIAAGLVGVAREVRIVDVTGLPRKAGASDVLPKTARRLVAEARPYTRVDMDGKTREEEGNGSSSS